MLLSTVVEEGGFSFDFPFNLVTNEAILTPKRGNNAPECDSFVRCNKDLDECRNAGALADKDCESNLNV